MCSLSASKTSAWSDSVPLCRQFWKAGEHETGPVLRPLALNGQNRLRVHPKFLHSNATSHKWVFGAIAELLDNAIDEVQHGATFIIVDKVTNPRNGEPALLIQDDGGGMDPESLRCCMSFGFSNKQSDNFIGQYGNGFKTSTMRLGADVIVFSRSMNGRKLTQSIGLLSYTFLRQTVSDDIVVPIVDYEFISPTDGFRSLVRCGEKQFYSNLSAILKWSPFATEVELLKQFDGMELHGTKTIIFNLWFNDDRCMELDFESNAEDIMVSGARQLKIVKTINVKKMLNQKHIATRFRYSLRVYSSILYLHLPENFKIFLRGKVVEPHYIAKDLRYCECIKYKPQGGPQGGRDEVITTIGFLKGAPDLNVHGFNVYHKNRLILPFWSVLNTLANNKGRGVAGVLEANFIKPTHDKQDFEKSTLYQKLETRLREMTIEYWNYHCHLVGIKNRVPSIPSPTVHPAQVLHLGALNGIPQAMVNGGAPDPSHQLSCSATHSGQGLRTMNHVSSNSDTSGAASLAGASQDLLGNASRHSAVQHVVTALSAQTYSIPGQFFNNCNDSSQSGLAGKRRYENHIDSVETSKKQTMYGGVVPGHGNNHQRQHGYSDGQGRIQENKIIIQENLKLRAECSEYENAEIQLLLKAEKLRNELQEFEQVYSKLMIDLESTDVKVRL